MTFDKAWKIDAHDSARVLVHTPYVMDEWDRGSTTYQSAEIVLRDRPERWSIPVPLAHALIARRGKGESLRGLLAFFLSPSMRDDAWRFFAAHHPLVRYDLSGRKWPGRLQNADEFFADIAALLMSHTLTREPIIG